MDNGKVLDHGSTVIGGGLGIDQIYLSINDLLTDGATGQEWLALGKGLALVVLGFFSWRRTL